jgi:hypothetical protein
MALCKYCRALPQDFFPRYSRTVQAVHQPCLEALESSANSGCGLCKILIWGIRERNAELKREDVGLEFEEITLSSEGFVLRISTKQNSAQIDDEYRTIAVFSVTPIDEATSDVAPSESVTGDGALDAGEEGLECPPYASSADSDEAFKLIRAWMDNCLNNHPLCEKTSTHIPTRLIDVGPFEEPGTLRLVETADKQGGQLTYLALSHCWGNLSGEEKRKMTTTSTNLEERLNEIPLGTLPQSFRDAVHATRSLGTRYLWIDSLCIIQDSDDDWQKESSSMGLIYQNALCTITANEAEDANKGIFQTREHLPPRITFIPSGETKDGKRVRVQVHPALPKWSLAVLNSPLGSRGWALQERQLSRRLVQFAKHEIFWECASASASEADPSEGLAPAGEEMLVPSFGQGTGPIMQRQAITVINSWAKMTPEQELAMRREWGDVNPDSPYRRWYDLVADFCSRQITRPTDSFPALAGISGDIAGMIQDAEYVAGLWKKDLIYGLSWITKSSATRTTMWRSPWGSEASDGSCTRPAVWRAPSWSWASICGPVIYLMEYGAPNYQSVEILEASSIPVSVANPMGAICYAFLRVRGFVSSGHPKSCGLMLGRSDNESGSTETPKQRNGKVLYDTDEDEAKYGDTEITLLFVDSCYWEGPFCLVLVPTGEKENEYRRIGWMNAPEKWEFVKETITIV